MTDKHEMAKKGLECCINSTGYFDPCERCPYEKHTEGCKAMLKDLADYIRGLEARELNWVSVIEDDPPEGSYVLAVGDAEDDVPAVAYIEGGKWLEVDTPYDETEVHSRWRGGAMFWMPTPELPKRGDHGGEPVRHGRWVKTEYDEYVCSLCGEEAPNDGFDCGAKYCYECGAKMDGGAE